MLWHYCHRFAFEVALSATNYTPTFAHHLFRRLSCCCKRIPSTVLVAFVHVTVCSRHQLEFLIPQEPWEHWWRTPAPKRLCTGGVAHQVMVLCRRHFSRMNRRLSCHALRDSELAYGASPDVKLACLHQPAFEYSSHALFKSALQVAATMFMTAALHTLHDVADAKSVT